MKLQILVSKKGTQVVTASNLHSVLQLPAHKFNSDVEKWLEDVYAFRDDVRNPLEMKDFAPRSFQFSKQKDYYLSLEFSKLITLRSQSKVKQKYARWLNSLDEISDKEERLSKGQVIAVLELTKVMGMISCQKSVEQQHHKYYEELHGFSFEWWQYRADLLGFSVEKLRKEMENIGKGYSGQSLLKMLMKLDKYEIIRMAVIDLFIALGKSRGYAKNIGDLAKVFAREMKVEIWDDRHSAIRLKKDKINPELVQEVQTFRKQKLLSLW